MQHPGPLLRVRLPRRPRRHRRLRLLRLRRPARPVPALRPRPDLLFRRHRHHLLRHGVQERAFGRGDGGRVPGLLLAFALLCPCRFHRGVHLLLVVREQRRGTRVRPLRVLIRSRGPLRWVPTGRSDGRTSTNAAGRIAARPDVQSASSSGLPWGRRWILTGAWHDVPMASRQQCTTYSHMLLSDCVRETEACGAVVCLFSWAPRPGHYPLHAAITTRARGPALSRSPTERTRLRRRRLRRRRLRGAGSVARWGGATRR